MSFDPFFRQPDGWFPEAAGLTVTQLAGVGFVVTTWAALESVYQHTLFVLAQSPDPLGQALTEDLSPDNRSKALKRLCSTWKMVLKEGFEEQIEAVESAEKIAKWIDTNKSKRNQIAHWNWLREDDSNMFGFKFHLKPMDGSENRTTGIRISNDELYKFAIDISSRASDLIKIGPALEKLPPWPQKLR